MPAEQFWRHLLKGFSSATPLPLEGGIGLPAARNVKGRQQHCYLSADTTTSLHAAARSHGLTLNTLALAAWALLLSRYSGKRDILFGATVSGRPAELDGVESMVGLFINTLPVRIDVSPEMALLPWMKEIQARQLEMRQYEYSPLIDIQGWSEVPRGQPLFRSSLVFENYPVRFSLNREQESGETLYIGDAEVREVTSYPLSVLFLPGEQIELRILYHGQSYGDSTISRILLNLRTILEGMADNIERRISELSHLSAAERHQALIEWNDTEAGLPEASAHDLIRRQVERTPDAVAVICDGHHLSYGCINRQANLVAQYLITLGVGPDVTVGLFMSRSPEMVVALLGVLKAGGAYVPLDAAYQAERLGYMLDDSRALVVLTEQRLAARLPQGVAFVESVESILEAGGSEVETSADVSPENLAYVIYTSGSTGKPKGVMIHHRGLVNYLTWAAAAYDVEQGRGAPVHSSIGFDLTVTSLFLPLLTGSTVVLLPDEGVTGLSRSLEVDHDYSLVKLTPAHLELLSEQVDESQISGRARALVIGGEALSGEKIAYWRKNAPATRLINEYGPTETVVGCCTYDVPDQYDSSGSVPIGRPIANMRMYIQGPDLTPAHTQGSAEISIGGVGLARGYLGRPDLTAEVFIPDPFGDGPGQRLYKTGDLGRYLSDGMLEFLGRFDNQVKIRGFRIELGEIENVLGQHPAVARAVVLAREDAALGKRLVAYVQPGAQEQPGADDLRQFLRERLPEYMVASSFIVLDSFPLTVNGKVDRNALSAFDHAQPDQANQFVGPRTPVEEELARIWGKLFGLDRIGIHDNFFELGGHSLLLTRLASRIREAFDVEMPLQALFDNPTVARMSAAILVNQAKQADPVELAEMIRQLREIPPDQIKSLLELEERS